LLESFVFNVPSCATQEYKFSSGPSSIRAANKMDARRLYHLRAFAFNKFIRFDLTDRL
jgi:hypothetical protein